MSAKSEVLWKLSSIQRELSRNDEKSQKNTKRTSETDRQKLTLRCFQKQCQNLIDTLKTVVVPDSVGQRKSQSLIIFGPPAGGKTEFLNAALEEFQAKHNEKFIVVRLNGLLCKNYKLSVQLLYDELTEALQKHCGQDPCNGNMHVDTESETEEEELEDENLLEDLGSAKEFESKIEKLESFFRSTLINSEKSVVIILEHLEVFASHPCQHLLYNLFDLTHSGQGLMVLGLTSKVDVIDGFEKRVKSRYSHRQIKLMGEFSEASLYHDHALNMILHPQNKPWNRNVKFLFTQKEIRRITNFMFETNKTLGCLANYLYTVLLESKDEKLELEDFQRIFDSFFQTPGCREMLLDLSTLHLITLVSVFHNIGKNSAKAWQPKVCYRPIKSFANQKGLTWNNYLHIIRKLETMKCITAVRNQRSRLKTVTGDSWFKCELLHSEFTQVCNELRNLPSECLDLLY